MMNYIKKYLSKSLIILFAVFISVSVLNVDVWAEDGNVIEGNGLAITPLRSEMEINPGVSQAGNVWITNTTESVMSVKMSVEEFDVIDRDYDYAFKANTYVADWVSFNENNFDLQPGEYKRVVYNVGVPSDAEPMGVYFGIFASTQVKSLNSNIASLQRVASLVYLTVSGEVTKIGQVLSLNYSWLMTTDTNWSAMIQNIGTTHFRSRYTVTFSNIFNSDVVAQVIDDVLILPGTIRSVVGTMPKPKWPGVYKVNYSLGQGDVSAYSSDGYIVYLPPKTMASIAFLMFFVILFVLTRKKS